MSIFHFNVKIISRGCGKSIVAAAAYRSGEKITNEYDNVTHNFIKKRGIDFSEILTPDVVPDWAHDRSKLWNAVENFERRRDARLGREMVLALPVELTLETQKDMVRKFVKSECVDCGMVADISYHGQNSKNPHCHILLTDRKLNSSGFEIVKDRSWNAKDLIIKWREKWEETINLALEREGISERVSCRSLLEQGINREPQIHVGPSDAKGYKERRQRNAEIKERNNQRGRMDFQRVALKKEIQDLENQINEIEKEIIAVRAEDRSSAAVPISLEPTEPFTKTVSERDKRIQQIAERVLKEQEKLRAEYETAYVDFNKLREMEPRGIGELFGESKKHKDWSEKLNLAKLNVLSLWKACGGDMSAPDKGVSEVQRHLTPEYAQVTAERIVADDEWKKELEEDRARKEKEKHAKLDERRGSPTLSKPEEVLKLLSTSQEGTTDHAEPTTEEFSPRIGDRVAFHVENKNTDKKISLVGVIVSMDDIKGTVTMRVGQNQYTVNRKKGCFTPAEAAASKPSPNRHAQDRDRDSDLGR
jgi:hypothetical protein